MIGFNGPTGKLCDRISRREVLRLGAIAPLGLSLPQVLRAEEAAKVLGRGAGKAKSIVMFYLMGGQGQLDTWDMRPDAPEGIRGEFRPIATKVPGTFICEHMPKLAQRTDKYAIIRSMNHTATNHNPGAYFALTGEKPRFDANGLFATAADWPNPGAIIAKFAPGSRANIPPFVQLSAPVCGDNSGHMPGPTAGFLRAQYEPLKIIDDPNQRDFAVSELALPDDVSAARMNKRRHLLGTIDAQLGRLGDGLGDRLDTFQQRAYGLVTSTAARNAFNIQEEADSLRARYGRHPHGQRLLLARRLVEAGVRFVSVIWGGLLNSPDDYWDTHTDGFQKQKDHLLPKFDACLSTFLDDLEQRGLLESTLVVVMGEFGRTPKVGHITVNADTDSQGRDHWPFCYSIVLAGGGVRGGSVLGKGDRYTAFPAADP